MEKGANILDWNGAIGEKQLTWFDNELREAAAASQKVVVFCHIPFAPEATSQRHLLWNWQQVLDTLDKHTHILACIYGHYHKGAYAIRKNVHHITLNGVLEVRDTTHKTYIFLSFCYFSNNIIIILFYLLLLLILFQAPITEHCYATLQFFTDRLELKAHGFQSRTLAIATNAENKQ